MAYVTGTANSILDLLSAIQIACTDNGWTLSGSVLHKGTCYIEVKVNGSVINVRGGTGIDGSNALTGACNTSSGSLGVKWPGQTFTFPISYDIHVHSAPDEVYVIINFDITSYQTMAFGQSAMPGIVGSGNWYNGPDNRFINSGWYKFSQIGSFGERGNGTVASLFCRTSYGANGYGVHHSLDSATWEVEGSARDWASLFWRQPNQWNSESILIPIRVYASRPSGFVSPVLECAHARFINIANLEDKQIITLGPDKWKVYPWGQRGAPYDANANGGTGSGVCGHAFRYDGP